MLVHVLGQLFHGSDCDISVRAATMVERIESSVRLQALLLRQRRINLKLTDEDIRKKLTVPDKKKKNDEKDDKNKVK